MYKGSVSVVGNVFGFLGITLFQNNLQCVSKK